MASRPLPPAGLPPPPLLSPTQALGLAYDVGAAEAAAPGGRRATGQPARAQLSREGFRIGSLNLMVRYEDGNELTDMPPVHRLPNAPAWLLGMANLHGALVPVFDPAVRLGLARPSGTKPMLLVLGHGDDKAGVVIDGVPLRLKADESQRLEQPAVPPELQGCVEEVYRIDESDWLDFRYAPFFERLEAELAA